MRPADRSEAISVREGGERRVRADAQRSLDALLEAAKTVFASSGVDAPVREIAARAGVGVGTVYRHFPTRSDLIAAVFCREIDAVSDSAEALARENDPFEALSKWIERYVGFLATKRGLATALHSGDRAYEALPAHRNARLVPAFQALLDRAAAAGQIRDDVDADDFLGAVGSLCMSAYDDATDRTRRMVGLLVDGLRYRPARDSD